MSKLNLDPVILAQAKANDAWRQTQKSERDWNAVARKRSPQRWKRSIDLIKNRRARVQVACLVWWDYFALKHRSESELLDKYRAQWKVGQRANPKKVRAGLIEIGYPKRVAEQRVKLGPGLEPDGGEA